MLLIDVKGAFDNVSKNYLLRHRESNDIYGDLMRWTDTFVTDISVGLMIDGHHC